MKGREPQSYLGADPVAVPVGAKVATPCDNPNPESAVVAAAVAVPRLNPADVELVGVAANPTLRPPAREENPAGAGAAAAADDDVDVAVVG